MDERNMGSQKGISPMRQWCIERGYVDNADYKSLHLNWIRSHQSFVPEISVWRPSNHAYFGNIVAPEVTYLEVMTDVYLDERYTQEWAFYNLRRDMEHHRNNTNALEKIMIDLGKSYEKTYFVTVGFNHQTFNPKTFIAYVETVKSFDWIKVFKAKFEIYRENGEHPHCHMKIETALPKSKIIEKLHRAKFGKTLILKKEFIDVKPFCAYHEMYLEGNKKEEKMKYVELDKVYRASHGIADMYTNEN